LLSLLWLLLLLGIAEDASSPCTCVLPEDARGWLLLLLLWLAKDFYNISVRSHLKLISTYYWIAVADPAVVAADRRVQCPWWN
jgi:hypothetical protein